MIEFLWAIAAMPSQGGGGQGSQLFGTLMPLILIFVIFYFLLIRPQQRKAKEHQSFLDGLEKGSDVVTNSGIIGKVTGITKTVVTLEVAPKIRMKFLRNTIAGKAPQAAEEQDSSS